MLTKSEEFLINAVLNAKHVYVKQKPKTNKPLLDCIIKKYELFDAWFDKDEFVVKAHTYNHTLNKKVRIVLKTKEHGKKWALNKSTLKQTKVYIANIAREGVITMSLFSRTNLRRQYYYDKVEEHFLIKRTRQIDINQIPMLDAFKQYCNKIGVKPMFYYRDRKITYLEAIVILSPYRYKKR